MPLLAAELSKIQASSPGEREVHGRILSNFVTRFSLILGPSVEIEVFHEYPRNERLQKVVI